MTQTSTGTAEYGMYGNRQDEFSYLGPESQAEIIEYCHALALMMDQARGILAAGRAKRDRDHAEALGMVVVVTMPDGFEITQAMIDAEIAETAARRPVHTLAPMTTTDPFYTGFHGVGHFA